MSNTEGTDGAVSRLGFKDGDVVQEIGWDEDVDETLRSQIEDLVGSGLEDVDYDGVVDAVGIPQTFELCVDAIRPGGHVANVGVHGAPVSFPIEREWINNITITTGLVNATTTEELLGDIQAGRISPEKFVTHRFSYDQWEEAYDTFSRAADEQALKVIVSQEG